MNYIIKLKSIFFLPFIFVYLLPSFGILLSDDRKIFFSVFIIPIIFFICLATNFKTIVNSLLVYYKQTPFRYFIYLYYWIIFVSILALFKGYYSINYFLIAVIIGFFFRGFLFLLYPMVVFPRYIKLKNLMKFFIITIYIILLIGIIEFIASIFNIQIILDLIHFFSNASNFDRILIEAHSSIPRIKALTAEPSALAGTITAFLPFIYNLSNCKYKIFSNKFVNLFIKKTIIPLTIFCLILTQSPLGLIFAICMTIYIFHEKIIVQIRKYFLFLIILVFLVCSVLLTSTLPRIDTSTNYLIRIVNVVTSVMHGNFEEFIVVEPSLATRLLNWINQFQIFFQHPITGVGFLNRGWILMKHLNNSTIPMTYEMTENFINAGSMISVNMTTTSQLLYQTGIIGFVLYVVYMVKSIKILNKIINYFSNLEKIFVISFKQHFVFIFINSLIYGAGFMTVSTFFAMGIANSLIILAFINRHIKRNIIIKNLQLTRREYK